MITINKTTFQYIVVGVILLLSEQIYGINYITLILVFSSIIYAYSIHNLKCTLFLLLLFSAMSQHGVNIYTFSFSGVSIFYITCGLILAFTFVRGGDNSASYISKLFLTYLLLFVFNSWLSVCNLIESPSYFLKDLLLLVFIPFVFYVLFKNMSNRDIFSVFYVLISIKIITSLIMYFTGLTLVVDPNLKGAMVIDNADELSAFFTILLLSMVLFLKHKSKTHFKIMFFLACIGLYVFGLGLLGLGSQVVLMIMLVVILSFYKEKVVFLFLMPIFILTIVFFHPGINIYGSELLAYKLNNIAGLISNLDYDGIYSIPHSPQVRVIELVNILNYNWYELLFGHGLGGYFTDQHFPFNKYIGGFDFSDFEIISRRFYNPHNISFGLLKMGVAWWVFVLYLFYTASKVRDCETKIFLLVAIFVLFLNFGFAMKTSILLAIVFIVMHNNKKMGY